MIRTTLYTKRRQLLNSSATTKVRTQTRHNKHPKQAYTNCKTPFTYIASLTWRTSSPSKVIRQNYKTIFKNNINITNCHEQNKTKSCQTCDTPIKNYLTSTKHINNLATSQTLKTEPERFFTTFFV